MLRNTVEQIDNQLARFGASDSTNLKNDKTVQKQNIFFQQPHQSSIRPSVSNKNLSYFIDPKNKPVLVKSPAITTNRNASKPPKKQNQSLISKPKNQLFNPFSSFNFLLG